MYRWNILRLIIDVFICIIAAKSYTFGGELLGRLPGVPWLVASVVGGSTVTAAVFWMMSKAKSFVFTIIKSAEIWAICYPEDKRMMSVLKKVTLDWKETFTIPVINAAVRKIFTELYEKIRESDLELPQILEPLRNSKIVKISVGIGEQVFDYADECVLAWCYYHEDNLFKESTTGIAVFMKHAAEMVACILPIVVYTVIIRFMVVCLILWAYFEYFGFSINTLVLLYVFIVTADAVIKDAILEPLFLTTIVKRFSRYLNEDLESLPVILDELKSVINFSEIESVVRRFSADDKATDDKSDTSGAE